MKRYSDLQMQVYETDRVGTIILTSDGQDYDIRVETE